MDNRAISCHPPLLTLSNQTQHDRVPLARGGGDTEYQLAEKSLPLSPLHGPEGVLPPYRATTHQDSSRLHGLPGGPRP